MGKVAFVFTGPGAQYIGRGQSIIENIEASKEAFDKANEILDFNLYELCFNENENINNTGYTQVAILVVSVAILEAIKKIGITPDYVAGLSLGEYSALVANSTIEYTDAISLVRKRGIFMEEAAEKTNGTMVAVIGSEKEEIEKICDNTNGIIGIANYNSPSQLVIAGETPAVSQALEIMKEKKIKAIPLSVSGAFHSPLMKEASEKIKIELDKIEINEPAIPYVSNVNAEIIYSSENIKQLLTAQVKEPVRWEESINKLIDKGVDTFIEIGPGKTLSGIIKKINKSLTLINVEDMDTLEKFENTWRQLNE